MSDTMREILDLIKEKNANPEIPSIWLIHEINKCLSKAANGSK